VRRSRSRYALTVMFCSGQAPRNAAADENPSIAPEQRRSKRQGLAASALGFKLGRRTDGLAVGHFRRPSSNASTWSSGTRISALGLIGVRATYRAAGIAGGVTRSLSSRHPVPHLVGGGVPALSLVLGTRSTWRLRLLGDGYGADECNDGGKQSHPCDHPGFLL